MKKKANEEIYVIKSNDDKSFVKQASCDREMKECNAHVSFHVSICGWKK